MQKVKAYFNIALALLFIFGALYAHSVVMTDPAQTVEWAHKVSHGN